MASLIDRTGTHQRVWRVFYTKPRAEKKAAERLAAAGVEVLLPLKEESRHWSDRKMIVQVPLFKSYLFANTDELGRLRVLEDEGIVNTVSFGGRMARVTEEEVSRLILLSESPDLVEDVVHISSFPVGTKVLVHRGPLKGVVGHIMPRRLAGSLFVNVPSLSCSVRVQVPTEWVRRISQ